SCAALASARRLFPHRTRTTAARRAVELQGVGGSNPLTPTSSTTAARRAVELVGVRGFEPPTPCSQSRCATGLRHTPPDPRADAPEPKVYHPVRKRRAARTARPRWSTRAFSSGASSAKVRRSGG